MLIYIPLSNIHCQWLNRDWLAISHFILYIPTRYNQSRLSVLGKLVAHIGDPVQSRLIMAITDFILFYGSEVWAEALKVDCRNEILSSVQRAAALSVATAFRTLFKSAILIFCSVIPIRLQASERKKVWETKNLHVETKNVYTRK